MVQSNAQLMQEEAARLREEAADLDKKLGKKYNFPLHDSEHENLAVRGSTNDITKAGDEESKQLIRAFRNATTWCTHRDGFCRYMEHLQTQGNLKYVGSFIGEKVNFYPDLHGRAEAFVYNSSQYHAFRMQAKFMAQNNCTWNEIAIIKAERQRQRMRQQQLQKREEMRKESQRKKARSADLLKS